MILDDGKIGIGDPMPLVVDGNVGIKWVCHRERKDRKTEKTERQNDRETEKTGRQKNKKDRETEKAERQKDRKTEGTHPYH